MNQLTQQTDDPTLWRFPTLYSPNRTQHIRALEEKLASVEIEVTNLTNQMARSFSEGQKDGLRKASAIVELHSTMARAAITHLESKK